MCDEDNKHMMMEFLTRLLGRKIEKIEFLRNELPVGNMEEKSKTIDVLVKIESEYIHIDLTYGPAGETEDYHKYYVMANDGKEYIKNMEIIEYNMDKIKEYWYSKKEEMIKKYKHLLMLNLKKEELKEITKGDKLMEEYERKINKLNEDETFQSAMTWEEVQRLILNTEKAISKEEGIEQGLNKAKKEVVLNMLKKNIDIDTISDVTGLSNNDILKFKNSEYN